ncbi:Crotonase superfamily [Cynara cardunculus var. scolymus]|uniref:3-hydroxyisobutyryl-CoA hydrolase n=1 Tax=Cynara cardunculus var. scolymus TaxID=59895 RepID=A0A118JVV1_CYNCS|nr:Crotonase superfamily [Cynara cardunculus var. scolymus]
MAASIHREADQVIFEEVVGGRKVILNRQKKLNTLNYEMLSKMTQKLKAYENDPTIKIVILKAIGKVFCVGGDLTSAFQFVAFGHWTFGTNYYRKEFCLDYILATYKKPLVAILDGSVMGGGVASMALVINKFAEEVDLKPGNAYSRLDMINQCFSGESCEEILSSLIREGRSKTLEQCLQTEYVAICHVLRRTVSNDFYEDVSDEMVAKCLSRSFTEDDDWLPLRLPSRLKKVEAMTSKI